MFAEVVSSVRLTYRGDHSDGEVKRPCEFPLNSRLVRFQLQHNPFQFVEVDSGQVVFLHQVPLSGVQFLLLSGLLLGFQRIEDGRSDQQIRESADDEREGPHVLPLHGQGELAGSRSLAVDLEEGELGWLMAPLSLV